MNTGVKVYLCGGGVDGRGRRSGVLMQWRNVKKSVRRVCGRRECGSGWEEERMELDIE